MSVVVAKLQHMRTMYLQHTLSSSSCENEGTGVFLFPRFPKSSLCFRRVAYLGNAALQLTRGMLHSERLWNPLDLSSLVFCGILFGTFVRTYSCLYIGEGLLVTVKCLHSTSYWAYLLKCTNA